MHKCSEYPVQLITPFTREFHPYMVCSLCKRILMYLSTAQQRELTFPEHDCNQNRIIKVTVTATLQIPFFCCRICGKGTEEDYKLKVEKLTTQFYIEGWDWIKNPVVALPDEILDHTEDTKKGWVYINDFMSIGTLFKGRMIQWHFSDGNGHGSSGTGLLSCGLPKPQYYSHYGS